MSPPPPDGFFLVVLTRLRSWPPRPDDRAGVIVPMLVPDHHTLRWRREAGCVKHRSRPEGGRLDALDAEGNIWGPAC